MFLSFLKDESGATAIEYGLIAGFIFLACVLAIGTLGDTVLAKYEDVSTELIEASSK